MDICRLISLSELLFLPLSSSDRGLCHLGALPFAFKTLSRADTIMTEANIQPIFLSIFNPLEEEELDIISVLSSPLKPTSTTFTKVINEPIFPFSNQVLMSVQSSPTFEIINLVQTHENSELRQVDATHYLSHHII